MLTAAQKTTLKANFIANTATIPAGQPWTNQFAGVQVKDLPNDSSGNATAAGWYSQVASPDFIVWRDLPMETVANLAVLANMTPVDSVPASGNTTQATNDLLNWSARSLACQGKQFNFQNLTIGRSTAPMKRSGYRAAIQDCLTNLPAGMNGALVAAGWTAIRDAAKFLALRIEQVLATGTGSTASPADMSYEGTIASDDIEAARNF